jgi:hypothetical protein
LDVCEYHGSGGVFDVVPVSRDTVPAEYEGDEEDEEWRQ